MHTEAIAAVARVTVSIKDPINIIITAIAASIAETLSFFESFILKPSFGNKNGDLRSPSGLG